MDFPALGPDSIPAIATLGARAVLDPPSEAELRAALAASDQPATIRGDSTRGVVATVILGQRGYVRFLAVDPRHRGAGLGRALLGAAENDLRAAGATSVTIGADAPYYLWPGIDARELATVCLVERLKYERVEVNFNMDIDLHHLPDDPGGWRVATTNDRTAVEEWATNHWEWWRAEMVRAVHQGGLVLAEDSNGIAAVCAYGVNRAGLVGPVAVRPDLMGKRFGVAPLLGALHRMRAAGLTEAEIAWVGPVVPYARIGATLGRTFLVYRKALA